MAMTHGDYVITEAGFAADLGAEKFLDIKCRKAGIQPALTIIVATLQGLKMHGGVPVDGIKLPNIEGVKKGFANMDKHIENLKGFGQTVLVCFNKFAQDTDEEIALVREHCKELGVPFALNNAFCEGGEGAVELANLVVETIEKTPSAPLQYTYTDDMKITEKITAVAKKIYGAASVSFAPEALRKIAKAEELGYGKFPVCIAKTQFSFSQDAKAYGVPTGFEFDIKDFVINAGAEMLVAIAGDIIRMPGLPKSPQALRIGIVDGQIEGLS
ncbi:MAG: formate--tetrahydrofolate ligase, partial [Bacteroidales bacterium]|nr:formate--tetrahydrofolate ligase [Candidatus Cryptobacteroides caccocaballi]